MLFLNDKIETAMGSEFLVDRFNLIEAHESMIGDGAGRHNIWAREFGSFVMPDGEYQKLLQEVGFVGLTIYIVLFSLAVFKCVINIKYLLFELCVIMFLLISMIGADPLSTVDKHPIIYWMIIGRVSAFSQKESKKI